MAMMNDAQYMKMALDLAKKAGESGDVPVGAVVVKNGEIISSGANERVLCGSAISHAEVVAIERACKSLGTWRLSGCTLYVTLEPCPMCAGAIINSRVDRVVFGAKDAKAGCFGSLINFNHYPFNHRPEITEGVFGDECASLLSEFFLKKR
jgi:tRNA(adenine34) deaminase